MLAAYFYLRLVHALVLVWFWFCLIVANFITRRGAVERGAPTRNPAPHTHTCRDAKVPTTMYFRNIAVYTHRGDEADSPRFAPPSLLSPCCSTPVLEQENSVLHRTPSGNHLTGLRCQPKPPALPHAASPTRSASPTWQVAAGSVLTVVPPRSCNPAPFKLRWLNQRIGLASAAIQRVGNLVSRARL